MDNGVSECHCDASKTRRHWPTGALAPWRKLFLNKNSALN